MCGGQGPAAVAFRQKVLPVLQPIEPRAGAEGTLQVVQQRGEGMAIPVPLTAADSTNEAHTTTARTT